jgi:hypothetical protein
MRKSEDRRAANRNRVYYPSDLTDVEWAIVERFRRRSAAGNDARQCA